MTEQDAAVITEMRRAIEAGPAYSELARTAPPRSCRGSAAAGEVSLEYAFASGDTLVFVRNPAIEYSQQEATLAVPRDLAATELLRQIERASFSPDGCDVDWDDATPVSENGATETAYYGETCNCQARVRTDGSGKTKGFVFRSAC